MDHLHWIQLIVVMVPPLLLAITLHEVAHGWTALHYGDTTARDRGRLSLNPLRHVDPIGTFVVPAMLFMSGGWLFGWAKPVPVSVRHLRRPRRDMAMVALAGPAANLVMAVLWALLLSAVFALPVSPWIASPLIEMGRFGIGINIVLAVLNLLPIPPLDGSKVLSRFLPDGVAELVSRYENIGLLVLLALLATGVLGMLIAPPVQWLSTLIINTFVFF